MRYGEAVIGMLESAIRCKLAALGAKASKANPSHQMATLATRPRKHWLAKIPWSLASRSPENDNEREPRIGVLHFDGVKRI